MDEIESVKVGFDVSLTDGEIHLYCLVRYVQNKG